MDFRIEMARCRSCGFDKEKESKTAHPEWWNSNFTTINFECSVDYIEFVRVPLSLCVIYGNPMADDAFDTAVCQKHLAEALLHLECEANARSEKEIKHGLKDN